MANDFFKNGDKVYSENLNDSVLVGNCFDLTVTVSLPSDTGSVFPNSSTVSKAKVCDVSITPNSNLSIGSTISNSSGSSQTYRLTVYPNFNRFGGFKSITLTADTGVTFYIANKGGTSPIANNLDYTDLGSVPELKVLKEYDIVVTLPTGKSVSGLSFVLQSGSADVTGTISQSNVTGLSTSLAGKLNVSQEIVASSSSPKDLDDYITEGSYNCNDYEFVSNKPSTNMYFFSLLVEKLIYVSDDYYCVKQTFTPYCNRTPTVCETFERIGFKNNEYVIWTDWKKISFDGHKHDTWNKITLDSGSSYGDLWVNPTIRMAHFRYYRENYNFTSANTEITLHTGAIPSAYRSSVNTILASYNTSIVGAVKSEGDITAQTNATGTKNLNFSAMWHY